MNIDERLAEARREMASCAKVIKILQEGLVELKKEETSLMKEIILRDGLVSGIQWLYSRSHGHRHILLAKNRGEWADLLNLWQPQWQSTGYYSGSIELGSGAVLRCSDRDGIELAFTTRPKILKYIGEWNLAVDMSPILTQLKSAQSEADRLNKLVTLFPDLKED